MMGYNRSYSTKTRKVHSTTDWLSMKSRNRAHRVLLLLLLLFVLFSCVVLIILLLIEEEKEEVLVERQLARKGSKDWINFIEEDAPVPTVNTTTTNTTDEGEEQPKPTVQLYNFTESLPQGEVPPRITTQVSSSERLTTVTNTPETHSYSSDGWIDHSTIISSPDIDYSTFNSTGNFSNKTDLYTNEITEGTTEQTLGFLFNDTFESSTKSTNDFSEESSELLRNETMSTNMGTYTTEFFSTETTAATENETITEGNFSSIETTYELSSSTETLYGLTNTTKMAYDFTPTEVSNESTVTETSYYTTTTEMANDFSTTELPYSLNSTEMTYELGNSTSTLNDFSITEVPNESTETEMPHESTSTKLPYSLNSTEMTYELENSTSMVNDFSTTEVPNESTQTEMPHGSTSAQVPYDFSTTDTSYQLNSSGMMYESENTTEMPNDFITTKVPYESTITDIPYDSNTTEMPYESSNTTVCNTTQCYTLSERVEMLRETSVDPCEDFYTYACSGDHKMEGEMKERERYTAGVLRDAITSNASSFEHVTEFYERCLQYYSDTNKTERTDRVREVYFGLESYDWRYDEYYDEFEALNKLIVKLLLMDGLPLFDISLDVSSSNSSRFEVTLMPHHISLRELLTPHYTYCQQETDEDLSSTYSKTMACMETATWTASEMVLEIPDAMYGHLKPIEKQHIDKGLYTLEHLLETIEEKLPDLASRKHILLEKKYVRKTVAELEEENMNMDYDEDCSLGVLIEWKQVLLLLFGDNEIQDDTVVHVYMPDYFQSMTQYLCHTDMFDFLQALRFTAAIKTYFEFVLEPSWESKETFCIEKTKHVLQDAVSSLYMQTIEDSHVDETMEKIEEMFSQLKEEMAFEAKDHLRFSDEIIDKIENAKIALKGNANQQSFQEELKKIDWTVSYPQLSLDLRSRLKEKAFSLYKKSTTSEESLWFLYQVPYSTYGTSSYALNLIWFSAGLAKNVSLLDIPSAMLWAWDGQILAHELMHLFDTEGLRGIVPDDELDIGCLNEKLRKPMQFKHLNKTWKFTPPAELVLTELFSDIGALDFGFKSFQNSNDSNVTLPDLQLTPSQLYFVTLAQWHCAPIEPSNLGRTVGHSEHLPPPVRVNEMVKDNKLFNEAFSCKAKTEATTTETPQPTRVRGKGRRAKLETTKNKECKAFPYYINQSRPRFDVYELRNNETVKAGRIMDDVHSDNRRPSEGAIGRAITIVNSRPEE